MTVYNANLWDRVFYALPSASSTESCGAISYTLTGLDPDVFTIGTNDQGQFGMWIEADSIADAKETPFTLDSCITIEGADPVCKTQGPFNTVVSNPCYTTQILTENVQS